RAARRRNKREAWLFAGLKSKRDLLAEAPGRLDQEKKEEWAEERYNSDLAARYDAISKRLFPGASLSADFREGELSVSVDSIPVIDSIFVDEAEVEFILAQWKVLATTFPVTEKTDGKKLANALRRLAVTDDRELVKQIIALEKELSTVEADIARQ